MEFHTPCPWLLHGPWIPTVSAKGSRTLTASWPVTGHANLWPPQSSKFVLCEHLPAAMSLYEFIFHCRSDPNSPISAWASKVAPLPSASPTVPSVGRGTGSSSTHCTCWQQTCEYPSAVQIKEQFATAQGSVSQAWHLSRTVMNSWTPGNIMGDTSSSRRFHCSGNSGPC